MIEYIPKNPDDLTDEEQSEIMLFGGEEWNYTCVISGSRSS
jgi:hypothetical protein